MIIRAARTLMVGVCLAAGLVAAGAASAQGKSGADQPKAAEALRNLQFRELGPAIMGGRVDAFAVAESNPNVVFVGMASGGLWKTTNAGTTWEPLFDKEVVSSIGDVKIAPSDPSIVWVGTGEPNNRQSSSWGDGAYKSTDGGKTWTHMGLEETRHIGRVVIHPTNPNIVYVAALGHLWGPNRERGLYKTTDGGKTWTLSLYVNDDTGVVDVAMDPQSPDTLYAAAYERRRTPYGFNGGGPHGAVYKTTDGGVNWKKLTKGLPYENGGDAGRIGLSVYRANPNIVCAIIQHAKGGIFRSEDKGETWTKMSDTDPRPSYYSQIVIDPNNDLRIWVLGAPMFYSEDGGKTFNNRFVTKIHGDFHALWISPADSKHMIAGTDGGIHFSHDGGRTWDFVNTIPLGQFYEVGVDMQKPYRICGGLQDNGSWCGPSRTLFTRGPSNDDWFKINGGDGFYTQADPADPSTVYTESQDGSLRRRNLRTNEARDIRPEPREGEAHYRFQWNSPVVISAHDHNTIYYGGNFLFKSTDRGDTWTKLGGDLTTGVDRNKLPILGKAPDKDTLSRHDGVQEYPTITTISESPVSAKILWAGTDDGNLPVTRDAGQTWKNAASRVPGLPKGTYISRVVASKFAEGGAYATFDGHRGDDYNAYIYQTTDFGETWKSIAGALPKTAGTVHVIREHPRNQNLLFAGTEFGLWVSWDRGSSWSQVKWNLPTVPVDDIAIHPRENDLIVGTHGRSIWVFDDLTPLEAMGPQVLASDLTLFEMRPTIQWRLYDHRWFQGHKIFVANNPPTGALISYYLKSAVPPEPSKPGATEKEKAAAAEKKTGKIKITILDREGKVVADIEGPSEAGVNRVNWDLRYNPPAPPTPEQLEAQAFGFGFGRRGPLVDAGEYTVKLSAAGQEVTRPLVVEEDPRIAISPADRAARREALNKLYGMAKALDQEKQRVTGLKASLAEARENWKKEAAKPDGLRVPENIQKAAEALAKQLDEIAGKFERPREGLGNAGPPLEWTPRPLPEQVEDLMSAISDYTAVPSGQQAQRIEELAKNASEAMARVKKIVEEDLAQLNKMMNDAGIPHIRATSPATSREGGRGNNRS